MRTSGRRRSSRRLALRAPELLLYERIVGQQPFYDDELLLTLDGPALPREKNSPWWATLINWDIRVLSVLPKDWVAEHWAPLHQELHFWATELRLWNGKWLSGAPPAHGARPLHFDSDASNTGGGLVMDDPKAEVRFHWLPSEMPYSINWKELRTPERGLRAVARSCNGALQQELVRWASQAHHQQQLTCWAVAAAGE